MSGARLRLPQATSPVGGLLVLLVGVALGLLTALHPALGGGAAVLLALAGGLRAAGPRLPILALGFLGICLVGYAFLGKGFAYVGRAPLFVGEMALGLGVLALLHYRPGTLRHVRPLVVLLVVFMGWGAVTTLTHLGQYGLDALRDAVVWAYGLFALVVAAAVVQLGTLAGVLRRYARIIPAFLLFVPIAFIAFRAVGEDAIPRMPGTDVPFVFPKGGDISVHLVGIMAFMLLGLHRQYGRAVRPEGRSREWVWWLLWMVGALSLITGRAALLSIGVSVLALLLLQPYSRWGRPAFLGVLLVTAAVALNVRVELGGGREMSANGLLLNLRSIVEPTGTVERDGSRVWRLSWWNDIENYTLHGPYFWTGKGYGINLATVDGYQVLDGNSLRNPHSVHMTFLARSGVPGLASWLVLQLAFALSLLAAHLRAKRSGRFAWAHIHLWLLVYWLAFIVNASFDVYLEGPQGGIWFWSVFGLGLAALELDRRGASA